MHRLVISPPTAIVALAFAASAHAVHVHATWSGTVAQADPAAPASLAVGTEVVFDAVYDPDRRVDHTEVLRTTFGGKLGRVEAVSLSDDPQASLTITAAGVRYFVKTDGLHYGTPFSHCDPKNCGPRGLGIGNLPAVLYLDGKFAGIGNILLNGRGETLDADPVAGKLHGFGLAGPGEGRYDFYIGQGDADNPFKRGLAVGRIDLSTLRMVLVR